jgi:glycerophosphoryl diester phosphodiesterase
VEGSILDYDWDGVQNLQLKKECDDFPCSNDSFEDSYIPLLEEVLLTAKENGINVRIELKGPGTEDPCLELVEKMGMVDQCSFSSFKHERVAKIRKLRPERKCDGTHRYRTGCLYSSNVPDDFVEECDKIGASEVHLKYDTCTKERVEAIHEKGMRSMAWVRGPKGMKVESSKYLDVGNEDEAMYQALINTGVMSMCVNQPNILVEMIASM